MRHQLLVSTAVFHLPLAALCAVTALRWLAAAGPGGIPPRLLARDLVAVAGVIVLLAPAAAVAGYASGYTVALLWSQAFVAELPLLTAVLAALHGGAALRGRRVFWAAATLALGVAWWVPRHDAAGVTLAEERVAAGYAVSAGAPPRAVDASMPHAAWMSGPPE